MGGRAAWGRIPQEAELLPSRIPKPLPRHAILPDWPELEFLFFFEGPIVNARTFRNEILKKRSFTVNPTRFKSKLPPYQLYNLGLTLRLFLGLICHLQHGVGCKKEMPSREKPQH